MVWNQLRTLSSGSRLCDKAPEAPNFEEQGAPGLKRWRRLCQVVLAARGGEAPGGRHAIEFKQGEK